MIDQNKFKLIRYLLICIVYYFIVAWVFYISDWINDEFLHFTWQNWEFIEWNVFIASLVIFGGFMLFMAPLFERWLYMKLEKQIEKINKKNDKNER